MSTSTHSVRRTTWTAVRTLAVLTLVLGIIYPAAVTGVAQLAFPDRANGSPVEDRSGRQVGSALLGQSFTDDRGKPLAQYFQSRPSAAGDGYQGDASAGSNLGPENPDLIAAIKERKAQVARFNHVETDRVPADAVTASASGLDPHISAAYAEIQVKRVARARHLPQEQVRILVAAHTDGPDAGLWGTTRVNVLAVNNALDGLKETQE